MARIQFADPSVQELEARRIAAELVNRITNPNLTDSEKAEAALNLSNLVELQTPGVEDALKMISRGDAAKEVLFWVPGIGQAMAAGELALNPTWENAAWAALSISPLTRAGGKAAKGAIKGAKKFADDITWEIKNALETAQDYIRKPAPKTRVGPVAGAKGEQFVEAGERRLKQTAETPSPVTATKPKPKTEPPLETTTSPRRSMTPEEFMGGTVPETPPRPRRSVPGGRPYDQADKRDFRTGLAALGAGAVGYGAQDALNLTASDLAETSPELVRSQTEGIDPLTPTPRMSASPTFETPGMTPRVPPQKPDAPDSEQPITSAPTDEEIENLLSGEGVPDRFSDDTGVVSDAFRRERDRAFGRQPGDVYYERDGMAAEGGDFERSPEGQAFLQSDVMPPELVKPDYMSDEEWAILSDAEKRRIMAEGDTSFASTFGAGTQ
jgi:hypothetical protein